MAKRKNLDSDVIQFLTEKGFSTKKISDLLDVDTNTIYSRQREIENSNLKKENQQLKEENQSLREENQEFKQKHNNPIKFPKSS